MKKLSALLLSDFNLETFSGYLSNDETFPLIEARTSGYGQVFSQILNPSAAQSAADPNDLVFVWTQPQGVLPSFKKLLDGEEVPEKTLLAEAAAFGDALLKLKGRTRQLFVASWVMPLDRGRGFANWNASGGLAYLLQACNVELARKLSGESFCVMLDANAWLLQAGKNAHSQKLWYHSKNPFHGDVYKAAVADLKAATANLFGHAKKLILLDLDDTLWGGIVGDVGWEALKIGGHDAEGEAFKDFQLALKKLKMRGVLLALVSKNDEAVALEAMRKHPEMILRQEDFAGWRINWKDKAQNIRELVNELNLGMQSAVFVDDNPMERARAREAFPELFVPEWPSEKTSYLQALHSLRCFDAANVTAEDASRSQMMVEENQRKTSMENFQNLEEWLQTLDIKANATPVNKTNIQRVVQLFNKTNQLNLSTRRLTEIELLAWCEKPHHYTWAVRVEDRFGDSGLVGIVSLENQPGSKAVIRDFILSCRVMGRKIEETLVALAVKQAKKENAKEVIAEYLPTEKNKPCLDFWNRSGFQKKNASEKSVVFSWNTAEDYAVPSAVRLIFS